MPFKLNPLTGSLDLVNNSSAGDVTGPGLSTDNAIVRWDGITGTVIQDSKTLLQDGGGIEAQGFITRNNITDIMIIHSNQSIVSSGFSIEVDGELVIETDGELVIV